MALRSDRAVVIVLSDLDSHHTPLVEGVRRVLEERGYSLLAHVHPDPGSRIPDSLLCHLTHRRPHGVVTTTTLSRERDGRIRALLAERGIPAVHLSQDLPDGPCVRADTGAGMREVMRHVLDECGARRVAFVRGLPHRVDQEEREHIYREELAARGLPVDDSLLVESSADPEETRRLVSLLLRRSRDVDAVVAVDDRSALATMDAIEEAGLRVPEDVVVSGFDDSPAGLLTWPGLTTVDQDLVGQGEQAARVLLARIEGVSHPGRVSLPCRLVIRGSTVPGAGDEARRTGGTVTVESVARLAKRHLDRSTAYRRLGGALTGCHTVEQVAEALTACLRSLRVHRCFLVTYEEWGEHQIVDGVLHRVSRLALDYRDGISRPVPGSTFPSCALLPEHLAGELSSGYLAHQELSTSYRPLGHLLVDHTLGPAPLTQALRVDLTRALESVLSARDLEAQSVTLEQLVARRTRELQEEVTSRRRAQQELQRSNAELERLLAVDGLTRIANRAAFQRQLDEWWRSPSAAREELALLMVDVDMFKAYNDRYGHLAGDDALRVVASCLRRAARRPGDLACRFGGEEFVVLLPRAGECAALAVARRFRRLLAREAVPHRESTVSSVLTTSVGIAVTTPGTDRECAELVEAADTALYRAKREGRDRIVVAGGPEGSHALSCSSRVSVNPRAALC